MYCTKCGSNVADGLAYCDVCGAELNADSFEESMEITPTTDAGKGLGIASMVMGIVSITCCNPFGLVGIVGLILGFIANSKAKASGNKNTFATVGIILCLITIILGLISSLLITFVYGTSILAAIANGSL